jgi:hypothetical protein
MESMLLKGFAHVNIPLNLGWRWISPASRAPAHKQERRYNLAPGIRNLGRIDMRSHSSVHGYGKLSIAPDAKAPLLVVFGGITVDNVPSGVYMWKYIKGVEDRFRIFVAVSK